jgi:hypothetical protein
MTRQNPNDVGYCGLYCPDCPAYKGRIVADLAENLRREMRDTGLDDLMKDDPMPGLEHYDQCVMTLEVLSKMGCRKVCKEGGGSKDCQIRKCAKRKHLDRCIECEKAKSCDKPKPTW